MQNLNEHINRMKQLFGAQHGIIKPLVNEQDLGDEDDLINKYTDDKDYGTSDEPKNDTPQGSSQYKKDEPLFGDEGNEMINKPGSGRKLQGSVNMVIKNLTTGKSESPENFLDEDEDWAQILQDYLDTGSPVNVDVETKMYGYFVYAKPKRENYNDGDSIEINFEVPLVVTSLEADKRQGNISYIDRQVSGNKTKIKINARIEVDPSDNMVYSLYGDGKTDVPSPFKEGAFNGFGFGIRFR